ncbi:MAG: hypothetical protein LBR94_05750 [Desulfovibrio sp.]|nr:hypothetical protein [Desulfovibrio sp.]
MKKDEICSRTKNRLSDADCWVWLNSATLQQAVSQCCECKRVPLAVIVEKKKEAEWAEAPPVTEEDAAPMPKNGNGRFEKITVAVPPDLKERFRVLSKGEMGSMSGQGRYLILRALEIAR